MPLYWFNRRANPAFNDKCESVFRGLPVSLKRLPEPDDSLLTLANVARGKGMALMPESMCVSMHQGLCYRPLDAASAKKLNIDVYIGVRKEDHRPQVMAALEKMLANGR
ncbi:hypothetical protein EDC52_102248 [Biostraticola tofi]|uniref:LysR substrate binding domain-containing protein n=1 Tax=Biostraticola tofi TaxID=466109 RepID=A0A4R3Z1Q0_9GAMM|nr:hypothetical protein [Biostraticola tofi]TCV98925.1 hypothetical protein EDC52_102248 [Biostraticola tofi]